MLQLEDNIWDEFGASATDNHIVPRTVDEYRAQFKIQGDGRTKPQHEVIGLARNADNTAKYGILSEKRKGIHTLTKNKMLEKCPWSHSSDGIFPTSGDNDSLKEVTGMVSDDPMVSSQGLKIGDIDSVSSDFCAEDPVLVDNWAIEDNNIYRFPLNHMSDTNGDLRFFNNNHEDKENCDLLCYAWGDIGNFEDVDRMFRSCDSTFGLGSLSNEDDLCWVSSSHATEGSQDVLKADAKLNSLPEHCATSRPDNVGLSTIDSYKKNVLPRDKISSLDTSGDNPGLADMSSLDVSNKESEIKDDLTPTEQVSDERVDYQPTEKAVQATEHLEKKQIISSKTVALITIMHKQNTGPDSVSYGQASVPYMHHNNSGPSNQISRFPTLTSAKSEINEHPSTNESSCASNQAQSMGKPFHQQDTKALVNGNINQARVESQIAFYDPVTVQKQVCQSEQDEDHSEVEGFSVGKQAELGFSNRTKLCIQDSLYRLGRTAEQRHNCTDTKNGIRDDEDASGPLVAEETNKCTRFMDIETDTNPIDRSTAHLLFHRSSDPSLRPATDTASLKSHGMVKHLFIFVLKKTHVSPKLTKHYAADLKWQIHGSPTARPASAEKQIDHEENGAVSDNNNFVNLIK
ncbi:protein LNK1-like [Gossypium arboreum]|uniref:protein LNK1-like n=1 Tax=Gossypium arboreum TaxID=29729 RepID=UPI0022F1B5A7|nr:protein LNK1-like [Gossypium arboreum]